MILNGLFIRTLALGSLFGIVLSLTFEFSWYISLLPALILMVLYFAVFHTQALFLSLAFFTPLSINIEEYTESFGLFLPTEPLLFGIMILLLAYHVQHSRTPIFSMRHPLVIALTIYIGWLVITSVNSTHPLVSFKSVLSKLWFVIPCFFFGALFFDSKQKVRQFLWWFTFSMVLVIIYTIINHSMYNFGEKESHWVMSPFFKDHTIYGAAVALILPFPVMLFFSRTQSPLSSAILIMFFIVIVLGLYFSYTRAAWLSVLGASGVLALVLLKIPFRWVAGIGALSLFLLFRYGDTIQMELARNKTEHTTEAFDERLRSATNVTTDASNLERINRWACAIEMFKERPLFGFGPGTYSFEYARFQEPENLTIISTNFGDMGNAHSEYLSALSESGIVGFILLLAFVCSGFYYVIRLVRNSYQVNSEIFVFSCGILFSLSTYFIHGILNNFLDTDKAAIPVFSMFAMAIILQNWLSAQPERGV